MVLWQVGLGAVNQLVDLCAGQVQLQPLTGAGANQRRWGGRGKVLRDAKPAAGRVWWASGRCSLKARG
ncbi:MAG: hypothetical protein ACRDQU_01950 [Pseudonocardiaceae bacterium]